MTEAPSDIERRKHADSLKEKVSKFISDVPYLSFEKFSQLRNESASTGRKLLIIDVREQEEIATSIIADAVPVSDAQQMLKEIENASNSTPVDIVCYCTVGLRSGMYARRLQLDESNVYNYSIMEHLWGGANLVHPQGLAWDGNVHIFSARHHEIVPSRCSTVAFGTFTALIKSLLYIPSLLSALSTKPRVAHVTSQDSSQQSSQTK